MRRLRYSEVRALQTFEERFNYLRIGGRVGEDTFGSHRFLNQDFYRSKEWKRVRREAVIRDLGCDLGIEGFEISYESKIVVHHINPITVDDILDGSPDLFDLNNLICCSERTHKAIHFGDISLLPKYEVIERVPFDTCPWR